MHSEQSLTRDAATVVQYLIASKAGRAIEDPLKGTFAAESGQNDTKEHDEIADGMRGVSHERSCYTLFSLIMACISEPNVDHTRLMQLVRMAESVVQTALGTQCEEYAVCQLLTAACAVHRGAIDHALVLFQWLEKWSSGQDTDVANFVKLHVHLWRARSLISCWRLDEGLDACTTALKVLGAVGQTALFTQIQMHQCVALMQAGRALEALPILMSLISIEDVHMSALRLLFVALAQCGHWDQLLQLNRVEHDWVCSLSGEDQVMVLAALALADIATANCDEDSASSENLARLLGMTSDTESALFSVVSISLRRGFANTAGIALDHLRATAVDRRNLQLYVHGDHDLVDVHELALTPSENPLRAALRCIYSVRESLPSSPADWKAAGNVLKPFSFTLVPLFPFDLLYIRGRSLSCSLDENERQESHVLLRNALMSDQCNSSALLSANAQPIMRHLLELFGSSSNIPGLRLLLRIKAACEILNSEEGAGVMCRSFTDASLFHLFLAPWAREFIPWHDTAGTHLLFRRYNSRFIMSLLIDRTEAHTTEQDQCVKLLCAVLKASETQTQRLVVPSDDPAAVRDLERVIAALEPRLALVLPRLQH